MSVNKIITDWDLKEAPVQVGGGTKHEDNQARDRLIKNGLGKTFNIGIGNKHLAMLDRGHARGLRDRLNEWLES